MPTRRCPGCSTSLRSIPGTNGKPVDAVLPPRPRQKKASRRVATEFEHSIIWALTRPKVRTKPGSNVCLRVHAGALLVRTALEFEHFDHVGSQNSSDPAFELLLTGSRTPVSFPRFSLHPASRRSPATSSIQLTWVILREDLGRNFWPFRSGTCSPIVMPRRSPSGIEPTT